MYMARAMRERQCDKNSLEYITRANNTSVTRASM
jgi:hypothetical protein